MKQQLDYIKTFQDLFSYEAANCPFMWLAFTPWLQDIIFMHCVRKTIKKYNRFIDFEKYRQTL